MLRLYNTAIYALRPLVALCSAWQSRDPRRRAEWGERLARVVPRAGAGGIWIHGSSVGEARIVSSLAQALRASRPEVPLVASAFTPTGRQRLPGPPLVEASFFLPLDFPGMPARILAPLAPRLLVLIETELWPNLLREAYAARVPVIVLNARLAAERRARYRRFSSLFAPIVRGLAAVGARDADDAAAFVELGAAPSVVRVTGNLKYDLPLPEGDRHQTRTALGIADDRPVWVAGSTGAGEDALVLDAFERVRRRFPRTLLLLAPRHLERVEAAERLCAEHALRVCRLSTESPGMSEADVVLVDGLGRLAGLYAAADAAFVGGSLVPVGGHNLLEPAAAGVPVLFGPHIGHVVETAQHLLEGGGAIRVDDAHELARETADLLADDQRRERFGRAAAAVVSRHRGALQRSVDLVWEAIADRRPEAS